MVGALAAGYVALAGALGLHLAWVQASRPRVPVATSSADLAPRAEAVRFRTRDGLELSGVLAAPAEGHPVVVLAHGIGGNRDEVTPCAATLAAAGYGVLTFDWRAHGSSEGDRIRFGAREPADLGAAVDFLAEHPATRGRPVAVVAVSLGAAVAALAAPELPEAVRALVLDSPYGDLGRLVRAHTRDLGPLAPGAAAAAHVAGRALTGAWPGELVPERSLQAFHPRPVMLLHGSADPVVPVSEHASLAASYPGPVETWVSDGDGHLQAQRDRAGAWMARVARFLHRALPGAPSPQAVLRHMPAGTVTPADRAAAGADSPGVV
jgi:alpha-beta hydrolase superfamily lysophospholipase